MNGGTLLLGVARGDADLFSPYVVEGIADPDALSAARATQCREQFNVPVRVQIATELISSRPVLVFTVPEAQSGDKPVYIKSRGLPKCAFRRIGSTDQQCTEDDLLALYHGRQVESFDYTILPDTSMADLSAEAIVSGCSTSARKKQMTARLNGIRRDCELAEVNYQECDSSSLAVERIIELEEA